MADVFTELLGRPNRLAEAAKSFMDLPEDARASLAGRTPPACLEGIQECINAVCEQQVPRTHIAQHLPPLYDAMSPHARLHKAIWHPTMKGHMTYFVVDQLRDIFCPGPSAPVAVTITAAASVPAPAPKPAAACLPAATASVSAWTILGEMAIGGLLLYLFRGNIPQFSTPSGTMGIFPSDTRSHAISGA